jgi:hypothetical protein
VRQDLERRLQALETSWFGSPRIAAHLRAHLTIFEEKLIRAMPEPELGMSEEELVRAIYAAVSGEEFIGPDVEHFSDAELERAIKDHDRAMRAHNPFDVSEK